MDEFVDLAWCVVVLVVVVRAVANGCTELPKERDTCGTRLENTSNERRLTLW